MPRPFLLAKLTVLALLSLVASSPNTLHNHPRENVISRPQQCIAPAPPPALRAATAELLDLELSDPTEDLSQREVPRGRRGVLHSKPAYKKLEIETYVHVLAKNRTEEGGWVSKKDIKAQMDAINLSYGIYSPIP